MAGQPDARGRANDGSVGARLDLVEYRVAQVEASNARIISNQGKNTALLIATLFTVIGGLVVLLVQLGGG